MTIQRLQFNKEEYATRLRRIRRQMDRDGVDALFVTGAHNVRYVTGFRGEPRALLLTADQVVLSTSFRCIPWAQAQTQNVELSTEVDAVAGIKKRLPSASTVGIEREISHERFLQLQNELNGFDLKITPTIEAVRVLKSEAEIAIMREAQRIAEGIFAATLPEIRPGVSERFLRGQILCRIAEREELDGPSFGSIVAAGENAWEIHHQPEKRQIRDRDLIIIDMGVILQGYCSDMTRTLCLGNPSSEMRRLYNTVQGAQEAAFENIKPGAKMGDVDAAARAVIDTAGYGETFTHGLGHPVGLSVHDPGPAFRRNVPDRLEAGMVMSVEPGAYLQDKFGVRIEDVIVVRDDGFENLMTTSKELISL